MRRFLRFYIDKSMHVGEIIGLATCNAWARAKHFGCPSVISSVCYPGMPL